jgi:selenocysteine lyase/cysteine desulfurase
MLECQKDKFSLTEEYVYLNCAYMSPLLKSVYNAGVEGLGRKSFPYEVAPIDFFTGVEALQKEFAQLINAEHHHRIAITASASYGIANAAQNIAIEAGDNIIVADEEFPSNYYIWERIAREKNAKIIIVKPPTSTEGRGKIWNERILSSIDTKTKVVAVGHVHWADGTKFDLKAIRQRTKEVGAYLIIDGSQSVGALPFDVQEIQPDALICVGYKWLMGPYSIGLAYYSEVFDNGKPIEESWLNRKESENFSQLVNYQSEYKPMAQRYNVGQTGNFVNVPMMTEAIRQLNEWKVERIQEYCKALVQEPLSILSDIGCLFENVEYSSPHLVGIRMGKHMDLDKIKAALEKNRVKVSIRGEAMRISTNVFNHSKDFERLIECFEK